MNDVEIDKKIDKFLKEKEKTEVIDCVDNFENYYEIEKDKGCSYSKKEYAFIWFASNIVYTAFYDDDLSLKWGEKLYRTVKAMLEGTQLSMIENHYEDYLICLNLINKNDNVLEWGSSIRYCWFEDLVIKQQYIKAIKQIQNIVE